MIHNSFIYVLIFLILTSRVNTECQSYPSLRCCPDTVWDDEQNKCVGCPPGSQGPNCAIPCSPPYYGKECQFKCACKGDETCHPSFGCVLPTTTTTTKIETTTKISTTTKITTTEDYIRTTEADVVVTSGASATTKTANVAVGVTLPTSTGNRMFLETSDTVNVKSIMLLGIFVLCGLFIVLFAVLVGTQIRYKCFNKNTLTTQSTTGVNLNSYDVINADLPPEVDMSQVNTKPGQRDSHYTEIDNYTEHVHKKNNDPHPCQSNINIHLQAEYATTRDRTLPKYVEIVGSPKNSTLDPGNELPTMSELTYSKQLYLSAV